MAEKEENKAPKRRDRLRRLLDKESVAALSVLVALMHDEGQKAELRMKAAESILDRACGKAGSAPPQGEGGSVSVRFEGVLDEWSR